MGGIRLRKVLTSGLVLIIFVSLLLSAAGVSVLVRGYLWNRGAREALNTTRAVVRFLEVRQERVDELGPVPRRPRRGLGRNFQRFNRGQQYVVLIQDGEVVSGPEDEERDWSALASLVKPGLQSLTHDGAEWQVLVTPVSGNLADQVAVITPWSPSLRLIRALILYQLVISLLVFGFALIVGAVFSRRLAKPLEELRDKTKDVGQHSVESLQPSQVLEITQLQHSFMEMSRRVTESIASQRRFVADASHELKTPLTAITGMLELLQSHSHMEPEDREQALGVAKKEADRMGSLISDLLLLSRAQAQHSGERERLKVADVANEQIQLLKLLFPDQEFELSGDLDSELEVNPVALARILRNLLENAARYAGRSLVRVELTNSKERLIISVRDSGPGIPAEKQAQLFERFYRTDSGRARTEGGHGLGLAIVKALVEEAGGTIACNSEAGRGAEFRMEFPSPRA